MTLRIALDLPTRAHWNRCVAAAVLAAMLALGAVAPAAAAEPSADDWKGRVADEFASLLQRRDTPKDTCISVDVDGESVLAHNADMALVPASLVKMATVAAAVELMGADERFATAVVVDAADLAAARDGVLHGDVHLVGGGDPVLATEGYMRLRAPKRPFTSANLLASRAMAALADHGIRRIEGSVIGDGSRYPDRERDYVEHTVAASENGASDNGAPAAIWKPSYRNTNLVGPLGGLTINDGFARYSSDRQRHVRSADPAQGAASDFDDLLEARGLVIRRTPRAGPAPSVESRVELASISSPTLSEIARRVLAFSENTVAEMLLKEIGHRTGDSAREMAVAQAQVLLRDLLGPTAFEITLADGSGLSVHNRMTCRAAVALLRRAHPQEPLISGLAVAGGDGTLARCPPTGAWRNPDQNEVRVKGGLLNAVMAVAGHVQARSGHRLSFAVISNTPGLINRGACPALRRIPITAAADFTYAPSTPAAGTALPGDTGSRQPATYLPPQGTADCTGNVPVVTATDASAQSDIYSAVMLAGVLGTDCIILAGHRDQRMPADQQARLAAAASGGYIIGGETAVPSAKLAGRTMSRIAGTDRWHTSELVGREAVNIANGSPTPPTQQGAAS